MTMVPPLRKYRKRIREDGILAVVVRKGGSVRRMGLALIGGKTIERKEIRFRFLEISLAKKFGVRESQGNILAQPK